MLRSLAIVLLVGACTAATPPPTAPPVPVIQPASAPATPIAPPAGAETRSWIGVRIDTTSLRISQLVTGAPAQRAGLEIGDELVSIDNIPVTSVQGFVEHVVRTQRGATVALVVSRGGVQKSFDVKVEPRPESPALSSLLGKPAPAFTATALSGSVSPKLADLRGHVVIVDFWATWCVPCMSTIPRLNELHHQHARSGLRIIGLSSEEPDVIRMFTAAQPIAYTVAHDPDDAIAKSYLREGIPMFVVIDKAGIVRHVIVGADVDGLAAAILPLL